MTTAESDGAAPIGYRVDGPAARITLAVPERRNALTSRMARLLLDAVDQAEDDPAVRVIVLGAEGTAFCSGADLDEADDGDLTGLYAAVLAAMRDATKPIVVRVQGPVRGGGNGLVASADVAVAVDEATFAFSEVRVGVVPAVVSVPCLERMRVGDARELMLTGDVFSAERARESGLVQRVVPAAELDATVDALVRSLCLGAPSAVAVTRQLLHDVPTMEEDEALRWTAALSAEVFASEDAREGREARAERRSPGWVPERFRLQ